MTTRRAYLDWNATAPPRPEARDAVVAALDTFGNPSSVHAEGRAAKAMIETARREVAALVGARPEEVVFTSGATEANATVIAGQSWGSFACSCIEHPSVLEAEPASARGSLLIAASSDGQIAIDDDLLPILAEECDPSLGERWVLPAPLLVSVQLANGETGAVQDIDRLVRICRQQRPDAWIHTDAAQAAGRVGIDFAALGVDAMTLSSHKLGGPQGVGALVVRAASRGRPVGLTPLLRGGGQELGRRAGTENVAAIAGFGAAAAAARRDLVAGGEHSARLRDKVETGIAALGCGAVVIGAKVARLPNTTCVAIPGMSAETLVMALDLEGIAVSAGAACSSGKVKASAVLSAMGLSPDIASSAIRVSSGWSTSEQEIEAFLRALAKVIETRHRVRKVA